MANELAKASTTETGNWLVWVQDEVKFAFSKMDLVPSDYQQRCAKEAFEGMKHMLEVTPNLDINLLGDPKFLDSAAQACTNCASLQLTPAKGEVYFSVRNVQLGSGKWTKRIEMGIQGEGYESLVRRYGYGVKEVGKPWEIKDTDIFEYPEYTGLDITPPKYKKVRGGKKYVAVVYPVLMSNGRTEYAIAERDDVMQSLFAHVKQNLQNETFGLAESRFKASKEAKAQIDEKKKEILAALKKCDILDEMLEVESAIPYMSPSWLDSQEGMILRKMKNKAMKQFKLDFNTMQNNAMSQTDEVYKTSQAEIEERQNSQDFVIDGEMTELDSQMTEVSNEFEQ